AVSYSYDNSCESVPVMGFLDKFSGFVVGGFESFFYWYGKKVSTYPWYFILGCLLGSGLCGIGLISFSEETNAFKLWVPSNSDFVRNNEWLQRNFPPDTRFNNILITAPNVLTPEVLLQMFRIHEAVAQVDLQDGKSWSDICKNVLELFGYNETTYLALTEEKILQKVRAELPISTTLNRPLDLTELLSLVRDEQGQVIGAKAATMTWLGQVDIDNLDGSTSDTGTGLPVDQLSLDFENAVFDIFEDARANLTELGGDLFINIAKGYDDIAADTIVGDAFMMPVGFTIVFIYVMIMLGGFTCVETRALLSLVGCASIGLTILVTYGLCSAFGLFYGPMHNVIPFLMLGIGIDDMFVIMQCFDNLKPSEVDFSDPVKMIGLTMKHAGVAITVTSLTDFLVFIVGSSTSLPALRSFCLYCGVGIIAVYFFQATFFVAALTLDLRRIEQGRNGLCFCFKHKSFIFEENKKDPISQRIFGFIGRAITIPVVKVIIGVVTLALLGVGIWGTVELQVRFESVWFLPPDSYLRKWFDSRIEFFPSDGELVTVYMTELNYPQELDQIDALAQSLALSTDIVRSTNAWFPDYAEYVNHHIGFGDDGLGIPGEVLTPENFNNFTSQFLTSPLGSRWQPNFHPVEELVCGSPLTPLKMVTFSFTHKRFEATGEKIQAMAKVKELISDQQFSSNVFAMTMEYSNWETDQVIESELYRNLGVSMLCIFVTTLILLANIQASILVMLCVVMTLVDVLGFMHFWGLTIDVVSSIIVIISIGLCVDYSAHIAHTFMTVKGDRNERAVHTLHDIGAAVLNGGISTFIALILLVASDSHVFSSFFRIFLLVVLFGLFHGLIFLPILLSLIGPKPYSHYEEKEKKSLYEANDSKEPVNHVVEKY
ncbi:hypothetical protein TCAL_03344, partial [Tigriopus californicus]